MVSTTAPANANLEVCQAASGLARAGCREWVRAGFSPPVRSIQKPRVPPRLTHLYPTDR